MFIFLLLHFGMSVLLSVERYRTDNVIFAKKKDSTYFFSLYIYYVFTEVIF